MEVAELRRSLTIITAAALLASLAVATVAIPASAATPKCRGQAATIVGTSGADRIVGTNRRDVIVAKAGNDIVIGRGGNDLICGGSGADRLVGRNGIDLLYGNGGADRLFGGDGPDRLYGGVGNDVLAGQVGPDLLDGGPGTDTCYQGQGTGPAISCELPAPPAPAPAPPPAATPTPKPTPDPGPQPISLDDILAVAFTDTNGDHIYDTGDVLIALLRDTDPGGTVSVDDTVEMGRYPLDFDASGFGDWNAKSHAVTALDIVNDTVVGVYTSAGVHTWYDGLYERYLEDSGGGTIAEFDEADDGVYPDNIEVKLGSPGDPQDAVARVFRTNDVDDPFIDVVLNHVVP